jgi:hypothetical protein
LLILATEECAGTVKLNRKEIPTDVNEQKVKLNGGAMRWTYVFIKQNSKKTIAMMSTCHSYETRPVSLKRGQEVQKPLSVLTITNICVVL